MGTIATAVLGVGNCASSLIQGLEYYRRGKAKHDEKGLGLMHWSIGGYEPGDIRFVAAFDVDERKVDKPLEEAIFAKPNCTKTIVKDLNATGVTVRMGNLLDGVSPHMADYPEDRRFKPAKAKRVDVAAELKKSGAEVALCYLPVGSEQAVKFYAEECLKAGVSLVNCMPVFIASNAEWAARFEKAGIPLAGDDIKAQIGATILHRALARLFVDRGVKIDRTYQLNTGGNTDFLNMLNHERLKSKRISKTDAVQSQLETPLEWENIHIGPSDYVPWQNDNKVCFLRIEGREFAGMPMELEVRLSVEDSPNSAGVVVDVVRCVKLARDRKTTGALTSISAYAMKHPPVQYNDTRARELVEQFIAGKIER
jgi:myo-inositol-1-phosphate synthase